MDPGNPMAAAAAAAAARKTPPPSSTPPNTNGPNTPLARGAGGLSASPRGRAHEVAPPPLKGGDESKLADIMARQRQAADNIADENMDEVTVETFEEIIEDETEVEEIVEEEEEVVEETEGEQEAEGTAEGDAGGAPPQQQQAGSPPPGQQQQPANTPTPPPGSAAGSPQPPQPTPPPPEDGGGAPPAPDQSDGAAPAGPQSQESNSDMSVEEFNKDDAPTSPYTQPGQMPQDHELSARTPPMGYEGEEEVDEDTQETPEEAAYNQNAYAAQDPYDAAAAGGGYGVAAANDSGDPYDQAYDNYNQQAYQQPQPDSEYPDAAAAGVYGTAAYGQPDYIDQHPQEQFEDEIQPQPPMMQQRQQQQYQTREIDYGAAAAGGQPPPPAVIKTRGAMDDDDDNFMTCCLAVSCCLLIMALAGVGVILFFWLDDDPFKSDTTTTRTVVLTPAPVTVPTQAPNSNRDTTLPPATAPTPTTPQPTPAPVTPVPTPPVVSFVVTNTLSSGDSTSGLGGSVSIAGDVLVLGEPKFGTGDPGQVQPYTRTDGAGTGFSATTTVGSTRSGGITENFGSAVDTIINEDGDPVALIGAARTEGENQAVNFGSATYLIYDGTTWNERGPIIRGFEELEEAGGRFGDAVAISTSLIVVAAPSSSRDINNLDTGRMFTFEYNGTDWVIPTTLPYIEGDAGSWCGTSIDLNYDGTRFLAGAPGNGTAGINAGEVKYYEWNGSNAWNEVATQTGTGTESFGMKVGFMNTAGTRFFSGGPTRNTDGGSVKVYNIVGTTLEQYGNEILGASGDSIGKAVCGQNDRIAVGTDQGKLRVYDYNAGTWEQIANSPLNTGSDAVLDCDMSANGETIVVGLASNQVQVHELQTQ